MTDRLSTRRTRTCAVTVTLLLTLSLAAVALAAARVAYSGQTSQQRPISFTVAGNKLTRLKYRIDDRCPGGKALFVNAWGFPTLDIKHARFGGKFVSDAGQHATATVRGHVSGTTISGTISDQRVDSKTHKRCSGGATFTLTQERHRRGSDG